MRIALTLKTASLAGAIAISGVQASAQSLQDGIQALNRGLNDKARTIMQGVLKSDPKNAQAYYYLGAAYSEAGQNDSARHFYTQGQSANANESLIYAGLGRTYLAENKKPEARQNFEKALQMGGPKNARLMVEVGKANLRESFTDADYAVSVLNKAVAADARNAEAFITLGDAYMEKNDGNQALAQFEKALQIDNKSAAAYQRVGALYARARSFDVAKENFEKAIAADPQYAPAYADLGEVYYKKNNLDEATAQYKKYVDLVGNSINERIKYASFLFIKKEYKSVIEEIEKIRRRDTSNAALLRLQGYSYYESGDYPKARAAMEKYFKNINPEKIITSDYEYMGKIYDKSGKDTLAVTNYKKALEKDSARTDLYETIANKYTAMKKHKDAAYWLTQKLKVSKTPTNDYYNLGKAYYNAKEYVLADSAFVKVIRNRPDLPSVYYWRALTNAQLDPDSKKGLAKPHFEQLIEKSASDVAKYKSELVDAYNYLTFYYYQKKDEANAKANANKVLELDPGNKQATEILKYYKAKAASDKQKSQQKKK